MRYVFVAAAILVSTIGSYPAFGQLPSAGLSISNYQLVGEQRISFTESYFTYRADLVNTGVARTAVTATVTSMVSSVSVVGIGNLHFSPVPASGRVTSSDTFTLLVDRTVPFTFSNLQWSFLAPVANAGPNQTAQVGSTVTLDGSRSSNPSGVGRLRYVWTLVARPPGSATRLFNYDSISPYFLVDVAGNYDFKLTVDNGSGSDSATLRVTTGNTAPVANAGPNQTAQVGTTVRLSGSGSSDVDGNSLTYAWSLLSRPTGSAATLSNPTSVSPSFFADRDGSYVAQLVVNDGFINSTPATVTITTGNTAPIARAGSNQTVSVGATVQLNGSASSDVDGDPLTFQWSLISRPAGSTAGLNNPAAIGPTFVADRQGSYIAQLIVSDGKISSTPSTVSITTQNTAPVANAGPNAIVSAGAVVQLSGAGSTDVDGDPLTFQWSLITRPAGSTAVLSNLTAVNPTFVADLAGTYVAQLIVGDGKVASTPDTVTITTSVVQAPTADAGANQTIKHGAIAALFGRGTDPQSLPLTFHWSLTARPSGSTAVLSNAGVPNPSFRADLVGTYVAQLIVNNGFLNSAPSTVTITTTNTPPVANAGANQSVAVGSTVALSGSGSSDADLDPLTYSWSLTTRPTGSTATLLAATSPSPTFVADVPGVFVAQLIVRDGIVNSTPTTVTITATAGGITLSPDPLNLFNAPATLRLSLGSPAPPGGQQVRLAALDPSVVSVPAVVTIPANTSGIDVIATPGSLGSTLVTATITGLRPATITVNVGRPTISITLPATTVGLTRSLTGTITISGPAPSNGVSVSLISNPTGIVTFQPAVVTIPSGSTSVNFTLTGVAEGSTTVTGVASGYGSGSVNVSVGRLGQIVIQPNLVVGPGQSMPIQVSLATPAPTGGVTIALASSDTTKVTIAPASVVIPQGATTPAAAPQVSGVNVGSATISGSAPGFIGDSETVSVAASLSFVPGTATLGVGAVQNLSLRLSTPAPANGIAVNLRSNNSSVATVPDSVTIPAGQTSVNVPVRGVAAGSASIAAIPVSPGIPGISANVTVVLLGTIGLPSNLTVGVGQLVPFPVTLSANAPGPVTVALALSDATKATLSTTSVVIPSGATVPLTQPQIRGVALGSVTITASAPGYGNAARTVPIVASATFTPQNLTITAPGSGNLTLTLSAPAPAAGLTIALSSSNTNVATAPASVTIPANATTVSVAVTGRGAGSAVIRANGTNIVQATANVTVQPSGAIQLPAGVRIGPAQSMPFAVTLPTAATSNTTVSLASSDTSKVTISPASVTILAGQTRPSVQPQVTGVNFGSSNITATAAGFTTGTQAVIVGATLSFTPATLILNGAVTQNVAVNLSANAPAGGLVIPLVSTNPLVATVPGSVTIPQGLRTVNVAITGRGGGSATISTNTTAANVTNGALNVTVVSSGVIGLPSGLSVAVGQSVAFQITLPTPAPAGGVTVTLSSSDPARATISPASVTIAAGQTQPPQQPRVAGVGPGAANITAAASGYGQASASVTVTGSIGLAPQNLTVGIRETKNLTVTISGPAPNGGLTINLNSSNTAAATVPPTVLVPQNTSSTTVPVTGVAIGSAVITASATNLGQATANVSVSDAGDIILPSDLLVSPGSVAVFEVTLARPAAVSTTISLASSDPSKVTLSQQTVFIAAGQTSPAAFPRVNGVGRGTSTITATAPNLVTARTTVRSGFLLNFSPAAATIVGTQTQNLTLRLTSAAPSGLTVNLSSSNASVARVPASVTFGTGLTSVNVAVTGVTPGATVITASAPDIPQTTANVTVLAPGTISVPATTDVNLGSRTPFAIQLSSPAPFGGVNVNLTTSDGLKATISPASVFIAAGQTTPATQPQVGGVNVGSANITASATGYGSATGNVQVRATVTWVEPNVSMSRGTTRNLQLRLSAPAPWGPPSAPWSAGLSVVLSSSNPSVVTTASSVANFFPDGSAFATVSIPVTAVGPGTAQIRASGVNIPEAAVTITVSGPLTITTTSLANGTVGAPYNRTLTAAGGASPYTWTLTSGILPGGLSFSGATLSGTPTAPVTNRLLTFRVSDSSNPVQSATATFALTISQQSPASISATGGTPQTTKIATPFPSPLSATVRDANNNPVSGVTVTFTPPASGAGGTFAGGSTSAITNAAGVATSTTFTANGTLGSYTVSASVAGVAAPAMFSLTNTAGNPSAVTAAGGTPQSTPINVAFAQRFLARVTDVGGNPLSNVTVTFSAPPSGPSGSFAGGATSALTNSSGVATSAVFTANGTAGSYTVLASVAGIAAPASFLVTNTAGVPASITATGGTPQSAPVNTPFASFLTALVRDASGNPLAGVAVVFTAPPSGPTGSFAGGTNTALTNASGVATSARFTANATPGSYAVTASVAGLASTASFALTNTGGGAASIAATGGTPQSARTGTAFASRLLATVRDAGGNPVSGASVTFTAPATGPSGGFAGSSTVLTNPSGVATSPVFTANALTGSYVVVATVPGVGGSASFALTNTAGTSSSIVATSGTPQTSTINTTFASPLAARVTDAGGNPVSGVTVTFTAPASGASGSFAGGVRTAVTNAAGVATSVLFTANAVAGSYLVSASVAGLPAAANFSLTNRAGAPASIAVLSGSGQSANVSTAFATPLSVRVRDAFNNPVGGVTVTFSAPVSGAGGSFSPGGNIRSTDTSGMATSGVFTANATAGTYIVNAAATGLAATARFTMTNTPVIVLPRISITGGSVGQNLQKELSLSIPDAAPPGGLRVTISSASPSSLLVAGRPGDPGAGQLTVTIGEGLTTLGGIYAQAIGGSGTVQLTASAPGYSPGTAAISLTPSGFVLAGPNGIGTAFTVSEGGSATLTVSAARLDTSLRYAETQQIRGGGAAVAVPLSTAPTARGTTPAAVTLDRAESSVTTTFNAASPGTGTITAGTPAGFSQPALGAASLPVTVIPAALAAPALTVGRDLQVAARVTLNSPAPSTGLTVTITSSDSSRVRFAATRTGTGAASLTLNVQAGRTITPDFYVRGLASIGTVNYTAMAPGLGTDTGTVTLSPSAFVLSGPFGLGADFFTTSGAPNADLTVFSARLSSALNFAELQEVRGDLSVTVGISSSLPSVGTITVPQLVFAGGTSSAQTQFDPVSIGTTLLSIAQPAGFSAPSQHGSLAATVRLPQINVNDRIAVGQNLQASGILLLGQPAPTGGAPVRLESNSSLLLLSTSPTSAGTSAITINIPAGQSSAVYYLHALGNAGNAGYTVSAPGYTPRSVVAALSPSGVVISGPLGFGIPLVTTIAGGAQPVTVSTALLDASTNAVIQTQALAAGRTVNVPLSNTAPAVGTIPTQATITGGTDHVDVLFTPRAVGATVLGVNQPAGFTLPANNTTMTARVN